MMTRAIIMAGSLIACLVLAAVAHNALIGFAGPFVGIVLTVLFGYRKKK